MKSTLIRCLLLSIILISLVIPTFAGAASDGNTRAMLQRAEEITLRKNSFVRAVLTREGIPYEADQHGVPVRIRFDDAWQNITKIDIVPLTDFGAADGMITGHALFFFTETSIYQIQSALPIRKSKP